MHYAILAHIFIDMDYYILRFVQRASCSWDTKDGLQMDPEKIRAIRNLCPRQL